MKKIYSTLLVSIMSYVTYAQGYCTGGRYASDTFTAVTVNSNITYGSNISYSGSNVTLTLDMYQPQGDTATKRPLIIWVHGGSFISGTSTDGDVVALSNAFAKKGYVCASINYRLGFYPIDSTNAVKAVLRAVQDLKAAIRFFYKDRLTANTYKIDTTNIFIGGSSAGALTVLHTAYLDKTCEINPYVNSTTLAALGGLDGNSGNPGYSQKIKGVISLSGALGMYWWLESGNIPFCSMHGTADAVVTYNRGIANPGVPLLYLDGSRMLYQQAQQLGVQNSFYTWYGQGHVPFASSTAYMDTTISFVRDYLLSRLGCTYTPLLLPNTPVQTATLYSYTYCPTGISEANNNASVIIYPNPSLSEVHIKIMNDKNIQTIKVLDVSGREVMKFNVIDSEEIVIHRNNLMSGTYFVMVIDKEGNSEFSKIIFQ